MADYAKDAPPCRECGRYIGAGPCHYCRNKRNEKRARRDYDTIVRAALKEGKNPTEELFVFLHMKDEK